MSSYKDYYDVLGVSRNADQDGIKSAFRKLAAKHHPDRNLNDSGAEERFKEINEAYTVLSDPEKRQFYNQFGTTDGHPKFASQGGPTYTNVSPEDFAGFSDFFQGLFGGTMRGGQDPFGQFHGGVTSRQNVQANLTIDLITAYLGQQTTVTVDGRRLEVQIPQGARAGTKLRLRGHAPGGGDLLLKLSLKRHPTFALDGDNVRVKISVPDYMAVLGGNVRVPTLDGDVEMSLPKGTQTGRVLRLRGKGWPKRTGGRGDELAEVSVVVPELPTDEQLELYQRLAAVKKQMGRAAK